MTTTTEPTDLRYHRIRRNVERDLRERYALELATLPQAEQRAYLESESRAYAAAYMAVAHPETA